MNLGLSNIYTPFGTAFWSFVLAFLGYPLGKNWALVVEWVERYEMVVMGLNIASLFNFVIRRITPRHRSMKKGKVKLPLSFSVPYDNSDCHLPGVA